MGEKEEEIICSEQCIELVKILRNQYYEYQKQKENMAWLGMAFYAGAMFAFVTNVLPNWRYEGCIFVAIFLLIIVAFGSALYFVKKQWEMKRHGMHIGSATIFYLTRFARGNFDLEGSIDIETESNKKNRDEYGYLPEFILEKVAKLDNPDDEGDHGKFGLILYIIIIVVFLITMASFLFFNTPDFLCALLEKN